MNQFAIIVTITPKPGTGDLFRPHILENATAAVRDESDCHQFQVLTAEDDPDTYYFYEVYSDAGALDLHRQQPHYKKFIEATKDMIEERIIQRCALIKS
ncbi:MAG: putative quinol monooxygenase [Kiloniellales bacterium]